MIVKTASAGSLESSDCLVTVVGADGVEIDYSGANGKLFQTRTERLLREILDARSLSGVRVQIQDQGALEVTLRARIEAALDRAAGGDAS